ncbi:MAG: Rpn family recombination-promoting nuclease/putative transposase [Saprospiraceae bacterium]|nr:Rpn family recombination-promoting nuclease/putative transposase [Saprospiraceae bacterium]
MEKGVNNPHDKFFKALLSDKESAVAFLKLSLEKETLDALDLESITLVNTHFISPELEESFSDIILSAKLLNSEANCYVSILLEHKSYKDDYVEFQVLYYLSQAYQRQIKNGEQLQLIIPIIYYHGEEEWSPPPMVDHFKVEPTLLKYIPNFERIFINLMSLTESAIDSIANTFLHPALQLQRNRFDQKKLWKILQELCRVYHLTLQGTYCRVFLYIRLVCITLTELHL